MKKGIIRKKGDGYILEYKKSELKTSQVPLSSALNVTDSYLGKTIYFEMVHGTITKVSFEGQNTEILKESNKPQSINHTKIQETIQEVEKKKDNIPKKTKLAARAPFNFVPLPEKIVSSSYNSPFDIFEKNQFTGYIEFEIKNLTPIFIRQISNSSTNFGYADKYGIPGSSIRGMIRNMCQIISWSQLDKFNDTRLYFRGSRASMTKIKAGLIRYNNENKVFEILPCNYDVTNNNRWQQNYVDPPVVNGNTFTFTSGKFGNQGCNKFVFTKIDDKPVVTIKEGDKIHKEYLLDVARGSKTNVFDKEREVWLPIFYQTNDEGIPQSIGVAKFHRIPYSKSIGEHNIFNDSIDLTQSVFGYDSEKIRQPSRVSFSDCISNKCEFLDEQILKILSSPKPTSFQMYLEQDDSKKTFDYDSDKKIRGNKLYWHKNGNQSQIWKEQNRITNSKLYPEKVKPIKEGSSFCGKIWFQNLSNIELGMLLMALEPNCVENDEVIAHKIGLGKPLGLGSIKISVKSLHIQAEDHYTSFKGNMDTSKNPNDFKSEFNNYICNELNNGLTSIWDSDRLKELKAMMLFDDTIAIEEWLKKTRYMEITRGQQRQNGRITQRGANKYQNKPILPKPTQVREFGIDKFVNGDTM